MVEWFDDLKVGMRFKSEAVTVSKDDIIRFAREYDPQPFHLDEEAAKKTILGGLAASGWHTAAIAMRLAASARPFGPHPLFGAGVDDLRWLKPVRPGDTHSSRRRGGRAGAFALETARRRPRQMDRL